MCSQAQNRSFGVLLPFGLLEDYLIREMAADLSLLEYRPRILVLRREPIFRAIS